MSIEGDDLQHFKELLERQRDEIVSRSVSRTTEALAEDLRLPDEADQASSQQDQALELRLADKDRKLLNLVEHALDKINRGEFGLCEGTGEPIERARLEARPWARYSVAHKEELERERELHGR